MKEFHSQTYQFKASLMGISPMIWRRFTVPDTLLLPQLHMVLQTLMGWENIHLYTFRIHGSTYGSASGGAFSDIPIQQFRFQPREKLLYTYDFSEFPRSTSWEIELRLERISKNVPAEGGPLELSRTPQGMKWCGKQFAQRKNPIRQSHRHGWRSLQVLLTPHPLG